MRSASPSVQRPAWQSLATVASPRARMFGSMGSGLMPGKSGSGLERICVVGHADAGEDVGENCAAGAVHGIDAELHAGFRDEVEVGEALNGFEVGGQEVDFRNGRGLRDARDGLAEKRLDGRDHGGLARAAIPALVLDAVPLRGVVRGGDHDAAGCAALAHAAAERRRGRDGVGEQDGNAGGRDDFSAGAGKILRAEARVVADAEAFGRIFLGRAFAGVDVGGDGLSGGADIREGEVVGDEAAPAVGAEFDHGLRHI